MKDDLIKEIKPQSMAAKLFRFLFIKKLKYIVTILFFFVWIVFIDDMSILVVNDLNKEIDKYSQQLNYYKAEYEKNTDYYNRLMKDGGEKEKYARENYFMKRNNEEIFIIVVDSAEAGK